MSAPALRVCIVAEHASTRLGGEAILPFHYFRILRERNVDAWLIVHERTRGELEALFPGELDRIRFVRDKALQKIFFRCSKLLPRRMAEASFGLANQMLTQRSQVSIVTSLRTAHTVVHQPIPVSPKFPSLLSGTRAPLILGPLNGGMDYPPAFRGRESAWSRAAIAAGRWLSHAANTVIRGKKRAAVILVANERTRAALPSGLRGRVLVLPENGVDIAQWLPAANPAEQPPVHPAATPATFLFMGRLVDWKALDIAIEALRDVPEATLEVIGDGPMQAAWRSLAAPLGSRVVFHGWLSQQDCAAHLRRARALVLPSLYECGGAVVLEAMACAKPVIATAWGGPMEYLDDASGILVAPSSRDALVQGFAAAMQQLVTSPEKAAAMGLAGRARVLEHFDWEKKVDALLEIYRSVLPPG